MFFILSFIPFVFAFLPAGGAGAVLFFGHGIQTKAWKGPAAWGRIFHPRMGRMSSVLPVWTDDIRPPSAKRSGTAFQFTRGNPLQPCQSFPGKTGTPT